MDEHSAVATTDVVSTDVDGRIVVWDMSRLMPILETGGQLPMYIIASMESPVLSAVLRNGNYHSTSTSATEVQQPHNNTATTAQHSYMLPVPPLVAILGTLSRVNIFA